jgi:hypothetical protein
MKFTSNQPDESVHVQLYDGRAVMEFESPVSVYVWSVYSANTTLLSSVRIERNETGGPVRLYLDDVLQEKSKIDAFDILLDGTMQIDTPTVSPATPFFAYIVPVCFP